MLVVFSPIVVADTKIIYGYNFVASLRRLLRGLAHFRRSMFGKNRLIAFPYYHYKTNKLKQLHIEGIFPRIKVLL